MGTVFVPKTSVQVIPEIPINSRTISQPSNHYTCPAGKKAIFDGYVVCTSTGSAANASLRDPADSFDLCTWVNTGTFTDTLLVRLNTEFRYFVKIELSENQSIRTVQSTGTNAAFEVIGVIQESIA